MIKTSLREAFGTVVDAATLDRLTQGQFAVPHVSAWIKDLDRRYVHVTPAWERLAGFSRRQVIGKRDEDFRLPEIAAHFRDQDLRILATGEPETWEDRFESSSGLRTFSISKFALHDSDGRLFALAGVSTETTDFRGQPRPANLSDALVATVLESMPEQLVRFTPAGEITFANASFVMAFASPGAEVVGLSLWDVLPVLLGRQMAAVAAGLGEAMPKVQFDRCIESTTGRRQWRQWRLMVSGLRDGAVTEVQAICRDITTERRYQAALEGLVATVRDIDADRATVISEVLSIGLDYFGLDVALVQPAPGVDAPPSLVLRPGSAAVDGVPTATITAAALALPVEGDDPIAVDALSAAVDGEPQLFATYIGQALTVGGQHFGRVVFAGAERRAGPYTGVELMLHRTLAQWLSFAIERHTQMVALTGRRAELSMIIESVPAHIAYKDDTGAVLMANATARALVQPPDSVALDRETVSGGRPRFGHLERWEEPDGAVRWMRADRVPFTDPGSAAPRILLVATDVTELIEKEQALRQANDGLNQFTYVASHDLQEPLRKIGTFTDLLVAGVAERNWADVDYAVKVIKDSSRRASALISDLLSWSRLTNRALERKPVAFAALVRDIVADVLTARPTVSAEVVDEMADLTIGADVAHVRQMIENLVVNAVKYRHPERPLRMELRLNRTGAGGAPVFEVEDNGIGFDPVYSAMIFEPFRRLHGERQYAGTGVGLAICTRVCERHGWAIRAIGVPGKGATFRVEMTARSGRAGLAKGSGAASPSPER